MSMGTSAALKSLEVVENLSQVIAIELLCACQAMEFAPDEPRGEGVAAAYGTIRETVPKLERDRPVHRDIESIRSMVLTEAVADAVEQVIDRLHTI